MDSTKLRVSAVLILRSLFFTLNYSFGLIPRVMFHIHKKLIRRSHGSSIEISDCSKKAPMKNIVSAR